MRVRTYYGPSVVLIPRTCSRCGREFGAAGREHVCRSCRAPKRPSRPKPARILTLGELAFREKQLVAMVQQAKSNKEIAYALHLTEGTVKQYLHTIFLKLGISSRIELAVLAIRRNFGETEQQ